jgi:hypothetical protein
MKRFRWSFLLLLTLSSLGLAQVRPTTPFSLQETLKLLDDGSCTLRGTAFIQDEDGVHLAQPGDRVILIPYIPYVAEYFELAERHGKENVTVDLGIGSCCIMTQINDQKGGFTIPNLKPGRYLVSAVVRWQGTRTRTWKERTQTGREEVYNGFGQLLWSNPTYTTTSHSQTSNFADIQRVFGEAQFTEEGQVLDIVLKRE